MSSPVSEQLPSSPIGAAQAGPPAKPSPTAHYVRLVAILAAGLVCAGVARTQLVPDTFGRDGHYRASALDEIVTKEPTFLGSGTCGECHKKESTDHAKGKHKNVSCENCHGPSKGHLTTAKTRVHLQVEKAPTLCLGCHRKIAGRPAGFPQVDLEEHRTKREFEKDAKCVDCHTPHLPEG